MPSTPPLRRAAKRLSWSTPSKLLHKPQPPARRNIAFFLCDSARAGLARPKRRIGTCGLKPTSSFTAWHGIRTRLDVEALFKRVREEQGRLDILVNNAWGGYEGARPAAALGRDVRARAQGAPLGDVLRYSVDDREPHRKAADQDIQAARSHCQHHCLGS